MRNSEAPMIQTPDGAIPEDEIPLPPLPAAADKDPAALMDTRYARSFKFHIAQQT